MKLGAAYAGLGRPGHAAAAYERACVLDPNNTAACVEAAAALLGIGQYDSAAAQARGVLARDRFNLDAQLILASALAGVRRFADAEERLLAALAAAPNEARVYRALGDIQRARGNWKAAEAALRKAIALDPSSAAARVSLSQLYLDLGRNGEGERELRAALQANPENVDANRAYGSYLVSTEHCADAEPFWKQVALQSPDVSGTLQLADYYVWSGRQDDALRVLESVPATRDGEGAARTRLASLLYDRGDRAKATAIVEELLGQDQGNVTGLLLKSRIAFDARDTAVARDYAHRAAQIAPSAPAVRDMLARLSAAQP
jgi:Tfp pilus assembly protein PilF